MGLIKRFSLPWSLSANDVQFLCAINTYSYHYGTNLSATLSTSLAYYAINVVVCWRLCR